MCRRFYNKDQVVRTSEDYSSLKKTRRLMCRIERFSGFGLRAPLLWPALQLSWPHPVYSRPESPHGTPLRVAALRRLPTGLPGLGAACVH